MTNMANVSQLVSNSTKAGAHDHQILSVLISCPDERCRRRAIGLFGQPMAQHQLEEESQRPSPDAIDANEQLPGYLREYDWPSFE